MWLQFQENKAELKTISWFTHLISMFIWFLLGWLKKKKKERGMMKVISFP